MTKNQQRVARMRKIVRDYAIATGDEWGHDREMITDILTDLMHMCAASKGDDEVGFEYCLDNARGHFVAERVNEKPNYPAK